MSTPGSDDVRRLSEELARDPSSLVFLQLGEALRRRGQMDLALKVAARGLERHPQNADAHDLMARIAVDRKELTRAFEEWHVVLRLAPDHVGALKGVGFIRFQEQNFEEAERYLAQAATADPTDARIASALGMVRERLGGTRDAGRGTRDAAHVSPYEPARPAPGDGASPTGAGAERSAVAPDESRSHPASRVARPVQSDARSLFHDLVSNGQAALVLDASGFVLAGAYTDRQGTDVSEEIGANLSGVSDEADRAVRHLGLGDWSSIVFETDSATVAMTPMPGGGLALVAADRSTPLGFVRRLLERVGERARSWVEGMP